MSIGIYKITNLINNKVYIGQSVNIEKRWYDEKRRAFIEHEQEYDYPRSRAFRKYGLENFKFEILEHCQIHELNEKEIYYIKFYNSLIPNGYNVSPGGSNSSGIKLDIAKVEEITELLQNTILTNKELSLLFNVSENTICGINTGYYWKREDINYPIRKQKRKIINICKQCGTTISVNAEYCNTCRGLQRRVCDRPSAEQLATEIIESSFIAVGKKYNVSDNAVRKWCKTYGMPTKKNEIKQWLANKK